MLVGGPHDFEPRTDAFLEQQSGAGFAQTAVYTVLFHCDYSASFDGGFAHRRLVQWLQRMNAQDPAVDAFFGQQFRGGKGGSHGLSTGQKTQVPGVGFN
jgi:hypothetical protein